MPQYDVRLSDGRTVRVNAPEGATQEQIGALAFQTSAPRESRVDLLRQDAERRRRIAEEQLAANRRRRAVEETGPLDQFVRGLGAGAVGMTGTALQGAAELLPDEYEEPVQEGIAGLVDYLRPELLVREGEGSTAQQIAATFGQVLGSTAPLLAASAVGGLPAAAALGAGAGAGEAGQRARRAGASDEEQMIAVLQGTGVGLTEAGPLGAVARLFRPAAKAASIIAPKLDPGWRAKAKAAYDYTVRRAGPAAAEEAAQESIASSLQNLIERGYNPEQDIFDAGVFEEGAYGAGVGATIQALADLAIRGRNRRIINEAYAEDEARDARLARDLADAEEAGTAADAAMAEEAKAARDRERTLNQYLLTPGQEGALKNAARAEEAAAFEDDTFVENLIDQAEPGEQFDFLAEDMSAVRPREDLGLDERAPAEVPVPERVASGAQRDAQTVDMFEAAQRREQEQEAPTTGPMAQAMREAQRRQAFEQIEAEQAAQREADLDRLQNIARAEREVEAAPELRSVEPPMAQEPTPLEEPVQESLPGMGRPYQRGVAEAPAPEPRVVTREELRGIGLAGGSRLVKRIAGKPFESEEVQSEITNFVSNMNVSPEQRAAVRRWANETAAEQQDLFAEPISERARRRQEAEARRRDRPVEPVVVPEEVTPEPPPAVAPEPVPAEEVVAEPEAVTPEVTEEATPEPEAVEIIGQPPRTKAMQKFLEKERDRIVAVGVEEDGVRIYTRSDTDPADDGSGTFFGASETAAIKDFYARVQPRQQAEAAPEAQPEPEPTAESEQEAPTASERREQARPALAPVEEDTTLPEAPPEIQDVAQAAIEAPSDNDQAAAMRAYIENPVKGSDRTEPRSPEEAMNIVAYDLMVRETYSPIPGTGGRSGSGNKGKASPADRALLWVRDNGGDVANAYLNARIAYWRDALIGIESNVLDRASPEELVETTRNRRNRTTEAIDRMFSAVMERSPDLVAIAEATKDLYRSRGNQLVQAVDTPLHPEARTAILNGDLQGAVDTVASTNANPFIRQIAKRLSKYVGNTTLELVDGLTDTVSGKPIAGRFSPRENKIYLDRARGVNTHTVLHELVHAAVSAALARPSSPAAKQLLRLFNELRPRLSGTYAATDVDEFVSEVLSNPDLQAELARTALTPDMMGRLVEGKPPKDGFTFWDHFKNTIGNAIRRIMGRTPVRLGQSVTDVVSQLTDSIMAPAPDYRGGADLALASFPDALNKVADGVVAAHRRTPEKTQAATQAFTDRFADFVRFGGAGTGERVALGFLPMNAVVDLAESARYRFGRVAKALERAVMEKEGFVTQQRQFIDAVSEKVVKWADKAGKDNYDTLNRFIMDATMANVDGTKPRDTYRADREKLAEWDRQQPIINKLRKNGGLEQFADLRDTYTRIRQDLLDALQLRVVNSVEGVDRAQAQTLAKRFIEDLTNKGQIDPYFPLYREGQFWLRYDAGESNLDYGYEAFETHEARTRRMEELQAAGATGVEISPPDASFSAFVQAAPPTAFIKDILEKIPDRKDDTGTSLRDEVLSTYMRLLPETALAKSFQRRKNTEGAIEDSVYVLQSRGAALARDVANLRGNIGIDQAMADLKEAGGKLDATDPRRVMYDELAARAKFAKNPPVDNWAKQMNRGAFIYTLGLNLSSAILNLSQVPLVVFPYLTAQYGTKRSWEEIGKAYRAVASSGFNRRIDIGLRDKNGNPRFVDAGATPSVDNFFETDGQGGYTLRQDVPIPDKMRSYLEDVEDIMRVAADRGMMHRSLLYDTLGIEEVGPKATFGDRASAFVGGPFHIAERVNRQVTLLATFRLAKEKLQAENANMDPARLRRKAAEQAIYQTQQMNGSNLLSTAPRYAQQSVGRVALMYKSFGIAMNYLMAKSAWNMLKNEDPATRKMAMRQLMGVHLSSLLMAGVQGMPIYGLAAMVWGLFQDDDELDPDTITRQYLGEGWWKGPLVAGSGLDFSTRIGLTDLLIRGNPYNREPSPEERLVALFGGPAASIASRVMTGFDELGEAESGEDFYRAVEKLMPAFVANPLQVARFSAQGGIKTRRGDPVYDDIGLVELGGKLIGFAPAEYTYRQEQNLVGKRIEESVQKERKKLYRQNYLAYMNGDFSEMRRIRENIADFNRRHPDAAITEDTLDRSIEANLRTNLERRYNGVIYNEQTKDEAMEAINGFRPGFWPFM